jgi:hypothetical protein
MRDVGTCLPWTTLLFIASVVGTEASFSYMSYYGVDVDMMASWVNLPVVQDFLDADAFHSKGNGTRSLLRMPSGGIYERPPPGTSHQRSSRLLPGWRDALADFVHLNLTPRLANDTAAGIFVGDEICCHNATCVLSLLRPLTDALRTLTGAGALIYANECGDTISDLPKTPGSLPPALDLFGVDIYRYGPGHRVAGDEVAAVRQFAESEIFPRFGKGQRFMAVPGTFTCQNESYSPAALEDARVAAELADYVKWAKAEPRVAGLNPWHFKNRTHPQHPPPCNMETGAVGMPNTLAVLQTLRPGGEARPRRSTSV